MSELQSVRNTKGIAAEYHVNNTLYWTCGAGHFKKDGSQRDFILFDNILLPAPSGSPQKYTEVDHLLISTAGIYAIETKSIAGKVFGERESRKWHSAQAKKGFEDGLYDRGFTNPFRQNAFHIVAIGQVLKDAGYSAIKIQNRVVLVDADATGWREGKFGGEKFANLCLSAEELAAALKKTPGLIELDDVQKIGRIFNVHYELTNSRREEFALNHA